MVKPLATDALIFAALERLERCCTIPRRSSPPWSIDGLFPPWLALLQVVWLKARLFGDFRQDCRTKFVGVVEREWKVRPPVLFHNPVGLHCAVMAPSDHPIRLIKCGKHPTRIRRRPETHAAMSNTAFAESGGSSPCAIRSRTISRAAD